MKKLFGNMKISHKLILISLSFLLPMLCLFWFMINSIYGYIYFAEMEKYGNEYQRPLETLLKYIPEHSIFLHNYLSGEKDLKTQIAETQKQIDNAFDVLEIVNKKLSVKLQFTKEGLAKRKREMLLFSNVKEEWENLKKGSDKLTTEESDKKHSALISHIRDMITHTGDVSKLILDPDLDSYYTMDVTLLALPQTQDRIASMITYVGDIISRKKITEEERVQLGTMVSMLKEADCARINASIKTALNEDAGIYGLCEILQNIKPYMEDYNKATEEFIALTNSIVTTGELNIDRDKYTEAGMKAREQSFTLWDKAVLALDMLLQKRIDFYKYLIMRNILFSLVSIIIALLLVYIITRNIEGILRDMNYETMRLLNAANEGKLDVRCDPEKINFEFRPIIKGINDTLDGITVPLNVASIYIERISKGDIPEQITEPYKGDFNKIKDNLNHLIQAMNNLYYTFRDKI